MIKTKPTDKSQQWVVYIVACRDGTLYTGITNDLKARVAAHNKGLGAKYTRPMSRRPVKVVYWLFCGSQSAAAIEEARIKKMSRDNKNFLISNTAAMARATT
jgi:predicted GIY-YIG superfamily endonuclease